MSAGWVVVTFCVAGYVIGSLPVGFWAARWRRLGLDLRGYGSGNVGTANLYRHAGFGLALVVGPIQFCQGLIPVLLAHLVGGVGTGGLVLVAVAAIVGNGWSLFLAFDGGRGVAVSTGVIVALGLMLLGVDLIFPAVLLACFAIGAVRGHNAEGVLCGFVLLPPLAAVAGAGTLAVGFTAYLVLIIARRLEGVSGDISNFGGVRRLVLDRVLHDRRPGRPLVGHRTDP
jgi:glycerol-3-phosphate acyltransferase PlsY